MKKNDLYSRIRRTILCQTKRMYRKFWMKCMPESYWKHPKFMVSLWYGSVTARLPHLCHPKNINEALMKLSIDAYSDTTQHNLRVQCADKFAVRQYVEDKGCGNILNELYGVYDSFDDIDFSKLPDKFVVKTNYGCGQNLICSDKSTLDFDKWSKQFKKWMDIQDFGLTTGEWHYTKIPHKIIVEKYLDSLGNETMTDFKFHCFNGKVFGCLTVFDRCGEGHGYTLCHYDNDWNFTDLIESSYNVCKKQIARPKNLNEMITIAEKLSADFPYCRVDLYNLDGQILFGELTFTPAANIMVYYTDAALRQMLKFYYETYR